MKAKVRTTTGTSMDRKSRLRSKLLLVDEREEPFASINFSSKLLKAFGSDGTYGIGNAACVAHDVIVCEILAQCQSVAFGVGIGNAQLPDELRLGTEIGRAHV